MRSLLISFLALVLLLGSWAVFMVYANQSISNMLRTIKEETMIEVAGENWASAEDSLKEAIDEWYRGRKAFSVFLNARSIDDIEGSMVKASAYVRTQEKPPALAELAQLYHYLSFLQENEKTSIENLL